LLDASGGMALSHLDRWYSRFGWTLKLAFLLICAWLVAEIAGQLVGIAVRPPPVAPAIPPLPAPSPPAASAVTGAASEDLVRLGPGHFRIGRDKLGCPLFSGPSCEPPETRLVPVQDGPLRGHVRLAAFAPGALLPAIGLERGDIVLRVNGVELLALNRSLDIPAQLDTAPRVVFEVDRSGRTVRVQLDIAGP
jgi:hypothetical protein